MSHYYLLTENQFYELEATHDFIAVISILAAAGADRCGSDISPKQVCALFEVLYSRTKPFTQLPLHSVTIND